MLAPGNKTELAVGLLDDLRRRASAASRRSRTSTSRGCGRSPAGATTRPWTACSVPTSSRRSPSRRSPSRRRRSCAPARSTRTRCPPYELLDEVLDAYVEHAEGRAELLARGFDPAVVDKVLALVDRAEWKRRQYPPGTKVTALAFGRDRRLPITTRGASRDHPDRSSTNEPHPEARARAPPARGEGARRAADHAHRVRRRHRADLRRGRHRHAAGRRLDREHDARAHDDAAGDGRRPDPPGTGRRRSRQARVRRRRPAVRLLRGRPRSRRSRPRSA